MRHWTCFACFCYYACHSQRSLRKFWKKKCMLFTQPRKFDSFTCFEEGHRLQLATNCKFVWWRAHFPIPGTPTTTTNGEVYKTLLLYRCRKSMFVTRFCRREWETEFEAQQLSDVRHRDDLDRYAYLRWVNVSLFLSFLWPFAFDFYSRVALKTIA